MDEIRSYLLSVIAAAVLCSMLMVLCAQKGTVNGIIRLLCGVFLALTMIRPIVNIKIGDFSDYLSYISQEGEAVSAMGESMADNAMREFIKAETEAYILDKAASMEMNLDVGVELQASGYAPKSVRLVGAASPFAKRELSLWLVETLGIPQEEQTWSG